MTSAVTACVARRGNPSCTRPARCLGAQVDIDVLQLALTGGRGLLIDTYLADAGPRRPPVGSKRVESCRDQRHTGVDLGLYSPVSATPTTNMAPMNRANDIGRFRV